MSGVRCEQILVLRFNVRAGLTDSGEVRSGFGEYVVCDNAVLTDSLVVNPNVELSYVPDPGDVLRVTSYMDFAFNEREIVPFADEFIIQTGLTAVDDTPTIQSAGGFHSVSPNPFNPIVNIKFVKLFLYTPIKYHS